MRGMPRFVPLVVTMVLVLGAIKPVAAESSCLSNLGGCFYRAAGVDNWLSRWLAGIDCELSFADCVADALRARVTIK